MVYSLLILIIGGLVCAGLGLLPAGERRDWSARLVAVIAVAGGLASSLWLEGFSGGANRQVVGAEVAGWLGTPIFQRDPLSSGIGAWTLAIGILAMLKIGYEEREQNPPFKIAAGVGLVGVLYSLAFTVDLRAFAAQVLLLILAILAASGNARPDWHVRQRVALAGGALLLLGAVLPIGRTTGGEYNLDALSLSALTLWPLVLVVGWALLWLGLAPLTGWSALAEGGLMYGLALGVPPIVLVFRLQALVTDGALTGSTPGEWAGAMSALATLGCITAIVGGASVWLWAGTPRWRAALTAQWMGMTAWALGLDSPAGRWATLALFATYGVARLALEMASRDTARIRLSNYSWVTRMVAGLSLAGAPLTIGFVGPWLLSIALLETRIPALSLVLIGAVVVSACGTALHLALSGQDIDGDQSRASVTTRRYGILLDLVGWVLAGVALVGGVVPGLWLPYAEAMAGVAGTGQSLDLPWLGIIKDGAMLPLTMVGVGALALALAGRLIRAASIARVEEAGALLPTALHRLQGRAADGRLRSGRLEAAPSSRDNVAGHGQALRPAPPAFVWWLSLVWLEHGIYDVGVHLARLGASAGRLIERLEGRYFLPLAVLLALLMVLAITR